MRPANVTIDSGEQEHLPNGHVKSVISNYNELFNLLKTIDDRRVNMKWIHVG